MEKLSMRVISASSSFGHMVGGCEQVLGPDGSQMHFNQLVVSWQQGS